VNDRFSELAEEYKKYGFDEPRACEFIDLLLIRIAELESLLSAIGSVARAIEEKFG
jgi:hypothetical protein